MFRINRIYRFTKISENCFFVLHREARILFALLAFFILCVVHRSISIASHEPLVVCQEVSFSECLKLFEKAYFVTVDLNTNIDGQVPDLRLYQVSPLEALEKLLEAFDVKNYAIGFDAKLNKVIVSSLSGNKKNDLTQTLTTLKKQISPNVADTEESIKTDKNSNILTTKGPIPTSQEMDAIVSHLGNKPMLNGLDDKVVAPNLNEESAPTLRQLKDMQEKARIGPDMDSLVLPGIPRERNKSLDQLRTMQMELDKDVKTTSKIMLPDGCAVNLNEIIKIDPKANQ